VILRTMAHILETCYENLRKISYLRKIIGKNWQSTNLELGNDDAVINVIKLTLLFLHHVGC